MREKSNMMDVLVYLSQSQPQTQKEISEALGLKMSQVNGATVQLMSARVLIKERKMIKHPHKNFRGGSRMSVSYKINPSPHYSEKAEKMIKKYKMVQEGLIPATRFPTKRKKSARMDVICRLYESGEKMTFKQIADSLNIDYTLSKTSVHAWIRSGFVIKERSTAPHPSSRWKGKTYPIVYVTINPKYQDRIMKLVHEYKKNLVESNASS